MGIMISVACVPVCVCVCVCVCVWVGGDMDGYLHDFQRQSALSGVYQ